MKSIAHSFSLFLCLSLVISLTACGFLDDGPRSSSGGPSGQNRPLEVNDDIFSARLASPRGLNDRSLFNEDLGTSARLDRLENVVQQIYVTLDDQLPAIERVSEIDSEIEELIVQLRTLVDEPAPPQRLTQMSAGAAAQQAFNQMATPPPAPADAPPAAPVAPPPARPAPAVQAPAPPPGPPGRIHDIRVSQNGERTRVVFDSNGPINYDLDYDESERLIIVTAPGASVTQSFERVASRSSLINTVQATESAGGVDIVIALEAAAKISDPTMIKPNRDNASHRYYFDIRR